ncbi:MAG TPA: MFS transporter, partial [Xanthomonadaceae bacterium]|nr:MFS transporter [Xanthomonadaceae bacterium]
MSATAGEDEGDKTAPHGWRGILKAFSTPSAATLFFLGFGSGLPFLLVGYIASTWMRDVGLELGLIGLVSYASILYTFKFFWAPLLDRFNAPLIGFLGRRRGWLILSQIVLVLALTGMGWLGPQASLSLFIACLGLAAAAGATQDTMVDAYRIEIAPQSAQAALAATYTLGYRIALIASGAGVLYLAEFWNWRNAYFTMAALMLVPLGAALIAREPDQLHSRPQRTLLES